MSEFEDIDREAAEGARRAKGNGQADAALVGIDTDVDLVARAAAGVLCGFQFARAGIHGRAGTLECQRVGPHLDDAPGRLDALTRSRGLFDGDLCQ